MYRRHNYEERLNIVSRILCGETIDSICREFQLDREMVRQWLLRYQKYGEDGLRGAVCVHKLRHVFKHVVHGLDNAPLRSIILS